MRLLLPALLLASALAGCTAGDDPATPPSADPNAPHGTLPPTSSDNTTGPATGTPTGSYSPSNSSSATGGPGRFGSHAQEGSASDADFSGIAVNGKLAGSGPRVSIEASATKFSPAAYKVPDGQCAKPWTERMVGPGGAPVAHRQPAAACAGFGLRAMAENEAIPLRLEWDGTVWDAAAGRHVPAPPGTYTWEATFHVYSGGSGASYDDSANLTLAFQVTVA